MTLTIEHDGTTDAADVVSWPSVDDPWGPGLYITPGGVADVVFVAGERGVVAFKKYPKAPASRSWDGAAARRRLAQWAGYPDDTTWSKFAQGFAWFDDDKDDTLAAYKLPHHDIIGGEIHSVWSGVSAAMGALLGARGGVDIPSGDRRGVYNHLVSEYRHHDKEPPNFRFYGDYEWAAFELRSGTNLAGGNMEKGRKEEDGFAPHLLRAQIRDVAVTSNLLLAQVMGRELGADTMEQLFIRGLTPSTQALDTYGTRMSAGTLHHFQADIARNAVPFMRSHRTGGLAGPDLPYGRLFNARLTGAELARPAEPLLSLGAAAQNMGATEMGLQVESDFYMVRGTHPNGDLAPGTDDLITQIEMKVLRDVSVGFGSDLGDQPGYVCALCGLDIRDWDCPHFPLVSYERDEGDPLLCFAWIDNAHLHEVSGVYAGATPGALINAAREKWAAGLIPADACYQLEEVYQTRIRGPQFVVDGAKGGSALENKEREVEEVKASNVDEPVEGQDGEEAEPVGDGDASISEEPGAGDAIAVSLEDFEALVDELDELRTIAVDLRSEVDGLKPLAELGTQYRTDLVEQAVGSRVRAGMSANLDAYRDALASMSISAIKGEIEAFEEQVKARFSSGRPTIDPKASALSRAGAESEPVPPVRRGGAEFYKV